MPACCLVPRPLRESGGAECGEVPVGLRGPSHPEPLVQLCFHFLRYSKSSLSSMLFEEQCNFLNWRLDTRDLKTSRLAVPE